MRLAVVFSIEEIADYDPLAPMQLVMESRHDTEYRASLHR